MQQAGQTDTDPVTTLSDQSLAHFVDRVWEIEARYKIAAIQLHLEACGLLLHQKDLIDISIFDRFKAGKRGDSK